MTSSRNLDKNEMFFHSNTWLSGVKDYIQLLNEPKSYGGSNVFLGDFIEGKVFADMC